MNNMIKLPNKYFRKLTEEDAVCGKKMPISPTL
jgi:hypothetical protein